MKNIMPKWIHLGKYYAKRTSARKILCLDVFSIESITNRWVQHGKSSKSAALMDLRFFLILTDPTKAQTRLIQLSAGAYVRWYHYTYHTFNILRGQSGLFLSRKLIYPESDTVIMLFPLHRHPNCWSPTSWPKTNSLKSGIIQLLRQSKTKTMTLFKSFFMLKLFFYVFKTLRKPLM